jgi:uncharacterized protein (TIGR02246 family)
MSFCKKLRRKIRNNQNSNEQTILKDIAMETKTRARPVKNKESEIHTLYQRLLDSWNNRDAAAYAELFADDGNIIGFDGSQANGKEEIHSHISGVFSHHKTASYVSIIKEIRFIDDRVAVLRAIAGMVPPGKSDINPEVNAIQTLIAQKQKDEFRIAVFQNTPAAFHGRPDLKEQMTKELREVLLNQS